MKKKIISRFLLGFPLGLAMGYGITIGISLLLGTGEYYPCAPELTRMMGSEMDAVLLQAMLCGLLGSGFAACSVIWEMENWGLAVQTGVYFLLASLLMMPIAYVSCWMEHSLKGVLSYFGIFASIFAVIWITQYAIAKRNVKKMNERLNQNRDES